MTCDGRTFGNSYFDFAIATHFLFFYASHTVPDAIESESADLILIINEFSYVLVLTYSAVVFSVIWTLTQIIFFA